VPFDEVLHREFVVTRKEPHFRRRQTHGRLADAIGYAVNGSTGFPDKDAIKAEGFSHTDFDRPQVQVASGRLGETRRTQNVVNGLGDRKQFRVWRRRAELDPSVGSLRSLPLAPRLCALRRLVCARCPDLRAKRSCLHPVSTITLFDGLPVADFDGLPASASRWL
jgi:hypothetical protein